MQAQKKRYSRFCLHICLMLPVCLTLIFPSEFFIANIKNDTGEAHFYYAFDKK